MNVVARMSIMAGFAIVAFSPCCGCGRNPESAVGDPPEVQGELYRVRFTAADLDKLPQGWEIARTGDGEGSRWMVVADDTSPSSSGYVIAQTAESPRSMFNLCVLRDSRYADLRLSVAFKAVAGEIDQGGGLVWRYVDANNYYICRFNPLEDNLRIYKVIAGRRHELASVDVQLPAGQWHTLTATMKGDLVVCEVEGARLSVRDGTLTDAGRVGLWTKADARTRFDAFRVTGSDVPAVGLLHSQQGDRSEQREQSTAKAFRPFLQHGSNLEVSRRSMSGRLGSLLAPHASAAQQRRRL